MRRYSKIPRQGKTKIYDVQIQFESSFKNVLDDDKINEVIQNSDLEDEFWKNTDLVLVLFDSDP